MNTTFRLMLIYMIKLKKKGKITDVATAFLYGDLEENIYMKIPEGFEEYLKNTFLKQLSNDEERSIRISAGRETILQKICQDLNK